jgi:hypothetical protein
MLFRLVSAIDPATQWIFSNLDAAYDSVELSHPGCECIGYQIDKTGAPDPDRNIFVNGTLMYRLLAVDNLINDKPVKLL